MLLAVNLTNTAWCKNLKNDWNPSEWELNWEFPASANQWIPTWQGLYCFPRSLRPCASNESSLSALEWLTVQRRLRRKGRESVCIVVFDRAGYAFVLRCIYIASISYTGINWRVQTGPSRVRYEPVSMPLRARYNGPVKIMKIMGPLQVFKP